MTGNVQWWAVSSSEQLEQRLYSLLRLVVSHNIMLVLFLLQHGCSSLIFVVFVIIICLSAALRLAVLKVLVLSLICVILERLHVGHGVGWGWGGHQCVVVIKYCRCQ